MTASTDDEAQYTGEAHADRRSIDDEWKVAVEEELRAGVAKFAELAEGQATLIRSLQENTRATTQIGERLNGHIESTAVLRENLQPAMDAIAGMQQGVRTIGKIGGFFAWIGRALRKVIVWLGPIIATAIAVWHFIYPGGGKW